MILVTLYNGVKAWAFGYSKYIQAAVRNVKEHFNKKGKKPFPSKLHMNPFTSNYRPEIYIYQETEPQYVSYYQSLIGIIWWTVELGRVDICVEVSIISYHVTFPGQGNLDQVLHIFGYLKKHHSSEMVLDPTEPDINMSHFEKQDWSQTIYGKLTEAINPNAPLACGRRMCMTILVNSDHAGESLTHRSRTGYLIFLNESPIYWFSKKIPSIEMSTFGAGFWEMKQAT